MKYENEIWFQRTDGVAEFFSWGEVFFVQTLKLRMRMWKSKVLIDSVAEAAPTMEVFLRNLDQQTSYTCPRSHPYAFNKVIWQASEHWIKENLIGIFVEICILTRVISAVQPICKFPAATSPLTRIQAAHLWEQVSAHPLICPALCKG